MLASPAIQANSQSDLARQFADLREVLSEFKVLVVSRLEVQAEKIKNLEERTTNNSVKLIDLEREVISMRTKIDTTGELWKSVFSIMALGISLLAFILNYKMYSRNMPARKVPMDKIPWNDLRNGK